MATDVQEIIKGSTGSIITRLKDANGDPYDLTNMTEISACFANTDGTTLTLLNSTSGIDVLGSALIGKIEIHLTATNSALLLAVENATLQVTVTLSSGRVDKFRKTRSYSILASVC